MTLEADEKHEARGGFFLPVQHLSSLPARRRDGAGCLTTLCARSMKAWIGLFLLGCLSPAASAADDPVAEVNRQVSRIEESIAGDRLAALSVVSEETAEGVPPEIRFHAGADGRLVAASITAGHESWQSKISWYFFENGKAMKYLRIITGRSDQPEREAVVYGREGQVIWKNVDEPLVDAEDLRRAYRAIAAVRKAASRY